MKWKLILGISLVVLAVSVGLWLADGSMIFTKTARQVSVVDPLFGTEGIEWEEGLWLGLDVAGPVAVICLVAGAYAFLRGRRES